MQRTIVYVSTHTFATKQAAAVIATIVAPAERRNASLGVTGALIATENHFAQLIEGPDAVIAALMQSIGRDPRHRDVFVVQDGGTDRRRFSEWSLAYQGKSAYFETFVRPLVAPGPVRPADVDRLVDLLTRLAAPVARPLLRDIGAP
ncbi:BLUF domain-containing protein [Sphingomonas sp. TREG-RG-20F-R18-01]|uniref:BLUF domain-containing protein n=1 Tax=Sphingomonas sp. TREG-RG-20F-R18-01 TaxID=2914982 RepID=UPI001F59BBDA|nr:BLUF domain-containing protein [Sphingomonas sp. TREG-RG-20F-R18-01]